jgi:hypothetical protein
LKLFERNFIILSRLRIWLTANSTAISNVHREAVATQGRIYDYEKAFLVARTYCQSRFAAAGHATTGTISNRSQPGTDRSMSSQDCSLPQGLAGAFSVSDCASATMD